VRRNPPATAVTVAAPVSVTMRPSSISMRRRVRAATAWSWVMMMTVVPSWLRSSSSPRIAAPALLCVLWGFQVPMERLLGYQELPSAVDWPARKRLSSLAADLTDLGVSDAPLPEAAAPLSVRLP
jgi:hypothetical protein